MSLALRNRSRRSPDPQSPEMIVAVYRKLGWRIAYQDCPDIADAVAGILTGWQVRHELVGGPVGIRARVARAKGAYKWRGPRTTMPLEWQKDPPRTAMEAVCDIHDVFFDWYLDANPDMLCLHGAAVRIGTGLVLFPSIGKAGKSVLTAALAAAGHEVFCDDVLAIEPTRNCGVALGFAPRLRQPLPKQLSRELSDFIEDRSGYSDRNWRYLQLSRGEIAPLGRRARIAGVVLLDRRPSGAARLRQVEPGYVLKELIAQNFARSVPPLDILARLHAIADGARLAWLTYSKPEDAAALLGREFGRGRVAAR